MGQGDVWGPVAQWPSGPGGQGGQGGQGARGGEREESCDNISMLIRLTSKKKVQTHLCPSGLVIIEIIVIIVMIIIITPGVIFVLHCLNHRCDARIGGKVKHSKSTFFLIVFSFLIPLPIFFFFFFFDFLLLSLLLTQWKQTTTDIDDACRQMPTT